MPPEPYWECSTAWLVSRRLGFGWEYVHGRDFDWRHFVLGWILCFRIDFFRVVLVCCGARTRRIRNVVTSLQSPAHMGPTQFPRVASSLLHDHYSAM